MLYIGMNEITKFTSHMWRDTGHFVWEKPHSLVLSTGNENKYTKEGKGNATQ
jgi:hypothetical protein